MWTTLLHQIDYLQTRVEKLEAHIAVLESQGKKNSKNSHKPPSTDEFYKPKPKSLRLKSGRKTGGQKGHPGHTLQPVKDPHHLVIHRVADCSSCGHPLRDVSALRHEKRQVFDLPPLQIEVTQHEAEVKCCPHCKRVQTASFPVEAARPVQYGRRVKALAVYLTQYQLLPYERTAEFFTDCLNHSMSEGTLIAFNRSANEALVDFQETVYEKLLKSPVVHVDETGIRVAGKRNWLHVASTEKYTAYWIHSKRGKKAMDEIQFLPRFSGVAVHDGWAAYFGYGSCTHALCNAHHVRELTAVWEDHKQLWAKNMIDFLIAAKQEIDVFGLPGEKRAKRWEANYLRILEQGKSELRRSFPSLSQAKKKGKKKQHPAKNLWDRLYRYREAVLLFTRNRWVPFDNNQAERDIRMAKTKQKISGTFRSEEGSKIFCRIRGFLSTMKKQGTAILEAIQNVILGNTLLFCIE